jgi:accessory gene regulator protein AgrB
MCKWEKKCKIKLIIMIIMLILLLLLFYFIKKLLVVVVVVTVVDLAVIFIVSPYDIKKLHI